MRDYYRVYANIDLDAIHENVVNAKMPEPQVATVY